MDAFWSWYPCKCSQMPFQLWLGPTSWNTDQMTNISRTSHFNKKLDILQMTFFVGKSQILEVLVYILLVRRVVFVYYNFCGSTGAICI